MKNNDKIKIIILSALLLLFIAVAFAAKAAGTVNAAGDIRAMAINAVSAIVGAMIGFLGGLKSNDEK